MSTLFDTWFNSKEWWHENTSYDNLLEVYETLVISGLVPEEAIDIIEKVQYTTANEYGG